MKHTVYNDFYLRSKKLIEDCWEDQEELHKYDKNEISDTIQAILEALDKGQLRIASKENGNWTVNEWLKKAILLSFKFSSNKMIASGIGVDEHKSHYYDKIMPKFLGWDENKFKEAGFRAVPGSMVRYSAYIAPSVILMPSFINVGAYIDKGTMIDSWATIGSCAQIGKNCHISGGVGIGGVLEPLQASPVIIEDNCFIGARSEIAEGVIVEEGAVLSMGVYIGASTKIIDRATGSVSYGRVPAYSVVVPGSTPPKLKANGEFEPSLYAAIIVKKVDARTREKVGINQLLRENENED